MLCTHLCLHPWLQLNESKNDWVIWINDKPAFPWTFSPGRESMGFRIHKQTARPLISKIDRNGTVPPSDWSAVPWVENEMDSNRRGYRYWNQSILISGRDLHRRARAKWATWFFPGTVDSGVDQFKHKKRGTDQSSEFRVSFPARRERERVRARRIS